MSYYHNAGDYGIGPGPCDSKEEPMNQDSMTVTIPTLDGSAEVDVHAHFSIDAADSSVGWSGSVELEGIEFEDDSGDVVQLGREDLTDEQIDAAEEAYRQRDTSEDAAELEEPEYVRPDRDGWFV